jgi:hypothetical protein
VVERGDVEGADEIHQAIIPLAADGYLGAREHYRLPQVLQEEGERARSIGHGVCAVEHDKAVETQIVVTNVAGDALPLYVRHVGRIHEGIVVEEAEEDAPAVGVLWGDHLPPDVPTGWPKVRMDIGITIQLLEGLVPDILVEASLEVRRRWLGRRPWTCSARVVEHRHCLNELLEVPRRRAVAARRGLHANGTPGVDD